MARKKGRGRKSKIQLLPPQCTPIVAWAAQELLKDDRTQLDIYEEFFNRLNALKRDHRGELEFDIPSFSSFNRHSLKLAAMTQRMTETHEIAAAIAEKFDAEASDDLTIIAAEAIKTLVMELITGSAEGAIDPKGTMQLAAALKSAMQAQSVSTARRQKVEAEFAKDVEKAVDTVARQKGMTAETADAIKAQILGVRS